MIDLARKLVAIDSSPVYGTAKLNRFIHDEVLASKSLQSNLLHTSDRSIENSLIEVTLGDISKAPGVLFVAHLDTADPGIHGLWSKTNGNPFELTIHGDDCFGLGVLAKFNFLAIYKAMEKFNPSELKQPITLVGTHSQENGLQGVREYLESTDKEFLGAIVAHPTQLNCLEEGLGISVVEIEIPFSEEEKTYFKEFSDKENFFTQSKVFRGKPAHSSRPDMGESAVIKMFEFLKNMPTVLIVSLDGGILHNTVPEHSMLEFVTTGSIKDSIVNKLVGIYDELEGLKEKFKEFPHERYPSKVSSLNIGKIRTNKDSVVITASCRLLPSVPEKTYRHWILNLKKICESHGAGLNFKTHFPSFNRLSNNDWMSSVNKAKEQCSFLDESMKVALSCTEANILTKEGISTALFGAGIGVGNSHQPNESISMQEVNRAGQFYEYLISSYT